MKLATIVVPLLVLTFVVFLFTRHEGQLYEDGCNTVEFAELQKQSEALWHLAEITDVVYCNPALSAVHIQLQRMIAQQRIALHHEQLRRQGLLW
jgi:hypothetical protein